MSKLREIKPEELNMPGDLTEESRMNQRSDSLAWFWRLDVNTDVRDNSWMEECECIILTSLDADLPDARGRITRSL